MLVRLEWEDLRLTCDRETTVRDRLTLSSHFGCIRTPTSDTQPYLLPITLTTNNLNCVRQPDIVFYAGQW